MAASARRAWLPDWHDRHRRMANAGRFLFGKYHGALVESVSYVVPGQPLHPLQVLAIPAFFVGAVSVYFLARRLGSANVAMVRSVLFTQFLLLALVCGLSETVHTPAPDGLSFVLIGTAIVLAIAVSTPPCICWTIKPRQRGL